MLAICIKVANHQILLLANISSCKIFPMEYKICTDKLPAAATVPSQEQSDLYMLVTTVKGLTCSNYKVKVNVNMV